MEEKFDKEAFNDLLYASKLDATDEESEVFISQIKKTIGDLAILRKYVSEYVSEQTEIFSETNLRNAKTHHGLETDELKNNSDEFLDGYFRVPKVLGE